MKLIDLHTHVMPGMDDGADCMATALDMLRNADAAHVVALAATPHCNVPGLPGNYYDENMMARLAALRQAAQNAGIPVKILTGMEVRAGEDLPQLLREGKLLGINGSRYLLTEFAPDATAPGMREKLQTVLDGGFIPLVAHPERYSAIWQAPQTVHDWLEMGCHVQITGGSILGKFGKNAWAAADYLIRNDLVAVAASDAHGIRYRTNNLMPTYDHLAIHYSAKYAQMLLLGNPFAICQNETL